MNAICKNLSAFDISKRLNISPTRTTTYNHFDAAYIITLLMFDVFESYDDAIIFVQRDDLDEKKDPIITSEVLVVFMTRVILGYIFPVLFRDIGISRGSPIRDLLVKNFLDYSYDCREEFPIFHYNCKLLVAMLEIDEPRLSVFNEHFERIRLERCKDIRDQAIEIAVEEMFASAGPPSPRVFPSEKTSLLKRVRRLLWRKPSSGI